MTPRRHLVLTDEMHRVLVSVVRVAVADDPDQRPELRKLLTIVKAAKKVVPAEVRGVAHS